MTFIRQHARDFIERVGVRRISRATTSETPSNPCPLGNSSPSARLPSPPQPACRIQICRRFPCADDVESRCNQIASAPRVSARQSFRHRSRSCLHKCCARQRQRDSARLNSNLDVSERWIDATAAATGHSAAIVRVQERSNGASDAVSFRRLPYTKTKIANAFTHIPGLTPSSTPICTSPMPAKNSANVRCCGRGRLIMSNS